MTNNKEYNSRVYLESIGYFTDNMWHIDDVKRRWECSDEQAIDILYDVMHNGEHIVELVNSLIDEKAKALKLKQKDEEI